MKTQILFLSLLLSISVMAQKSDLEKKLQLYNQPIDYEAYTLKAINKATLQLAENKLDSVTNTVNNWTFLCGRSEISQRILIITAILKGEDTSHYIQQYINDDFYYYLYQRLEDTKYTRRTALYYERKAYYNYVPLGHPIDSIIMEKAKKLLENPRNLDEELLLILFSGNTNKFDDALKKRKYERGIIKPHIRKNNFNVTSAVTLYTGIYTHQGKNNILGNSSTIGMTYTSNLYKKYMLGFHLKFRINNNDKDFNYYAFDSINTVNSNLSYSLGILAGYK